MCGYEFTKGETYLVYAGENPVNHLWTASECSRTCVLRQGGDDVESLGGPLSIAAGWSFPTTGTVRVFVGWREPNSPALRLPGTHFVGIGNATVRLEGWKDVLVTDRLGNAEFRDVRPGHFVLRVEADGWVQQGPETLSIGAGKFVSRAVVLSTKSAE
jgi:hypothetical protein